MYTHLSQTERYQIYSLMKAGQSIAQIAKLLGRHRSTVWREIQRGCGGRGYRPSQAQHLADERATASRNAAQMSDPCWAQVQQCLYQQWSPEQIAAHVDASHESIYQRIYADKAAGGDLYMHLRSQKKRRKRHACGRDRRGHIPNRRPISERPAHINERAQVGHWEGDTMIGKGHKKAIVTVVERKSGYAMLALVDAKSAALVGQAMQECLEPVAALVKTMTLDNGKEFAQHEQFDQALNCATYFADPYSSWQRGSNENFNGLVRQFIPKSRHLNTVTHEELAMIEDKLNHRPRKRLGFKTPHEVFHASFKRVALRA
jgi:transposase, IS30 family